MTKIYDDGEIRDMTKAEEAEAEQSVLEQLRAYIERPLDLQYKVELLIDAIPVMPKPEDREGYSWIPLFNAQQMCFGWEEVKNPYFTAEADGTYLHPFTYADDVPCVRGLWYTDGEDIWECIMSGYPSRFADPNYFEVIE